MYIALYIDPNISPISTFYTVIELKKIFELNEQTFDIFIPYVEKTITNNDDCWVNKKFSDTYKYSIIWDKLPSPDSYDVLCLSHIWSKKWNGKDNRIDLAEKFQNKSKIVLCLKFDTTLEHRFINEKTIYGVNSKYYLDLEKRWILPRNCQTFIFPQISNLSIPKNKSLTYTEFCEKYKLDIKKKIIIFFMGRFEKWYDSKVINSQNMYFFLENYNRFLKKINDFECQIIFKLHRSDSVQLINIYELQNLNIIDSYDTHEAVKFSSYAFTFASSIVYELYLYDLPVLDLGYGIYYPGWITDINKKRQLKCMKEYDYGQKIIFGMILGNNNFFKVLSKFINNFNKAKIIDYQYLNNHPIFGKSYYNGIYDIYKSLVNVISVERETIQ